MTPQLEHQPRVLTGVVPSVIGGGTRVFAAVTLSPLVALMVGVPVGALAALVAIALTLAALVGRIVVVMRAHSGQ